MNKNNLLNLGLLALIGVLVLLVVYEPGIEEPEEQPTLLKIDKTAISQIAITRDGQQDVQLIKQENGEWWMDKPIKHAADSLRIGSLLRIATIKSLGSFAAEQDKLAAYKLAEPQVTLTLNNDTVIAFGGSTPLDHRRYVMVNNRVHLITDTLYYHLIGSFPTFLRKQLLSEGSSIDAITLPGLSVRWEEKRWHLEPAPEQFSADQVTKLMDNWKLASALDIKPYDGNPGEKITIHIASSEEPVELLVTSRQPDLILSNPELGIQYHLDASNAEGLLQLPDMEEENTEQEQQPASADEHGHSH